MRKQALAFLLVGSASLACSQGGQAASAAAPPGAAAASVAVPTASAEDVVAEVAGGKITLAEVDRKAAGRLARVRDEEYEARKQALDELVAEKLVAKEAAARGMTSEALLKAEVDDKVKKPEKTEIETLYTINKDRVGGRSLAEVAPQIERQMLAQRLAERRAAFHSDLKTKAAVQVSLPQPRTAVNIPADAPSLGPKDAKVTVVEFLDYQCPYCHRVQGVVDEIVGRYAGKVRFVHRDFPLDMHPQAAVASRAAHCAGEQDRFWDYHKNLLTVPGDMSDQDLKTRAASLRLETAKFGSCLASDRYAREVQETMDYGLQLGITGTPTFFINGRRLVGVRPIEDFRAAIEAELSAAP
ncbi:MAG TPA: thioredoxin domain-containing protein [Vicinamibacteria bacterium]|nr:thioredoxin domain-containing protein [Vicinamibacteria bacterium]